MLLNLPDSSSALLLLNSSAVPIAERLAGTNHLLAEQPSYTAVTVTARHYLSQHQ